VHQLPQSCGLAKGTPERPMTRAQLHCRGAFFMYTSYRAAGVHRQVVHWLMHVQDTNMWSCSHRPAGVFLTAVTNGTPLHLIYLTKTFCILQSNRNCPNPYLDHPVALTAFTGCLHSAREGPDAILLAINLQEEVQCVINSCSSIGTPMNLPT
jgi:hypothetical protein